MLYGDVVYNKRKDIHSVDQFGFVNVTKAFESGAVPASVAPTPEQFNGIESPEAVLGRPSDVFEAYRMRDYVMKSSGGASGSDSSESVPDKD